MKQVLLSDVCEINPSIDSGISDDAECSFVPMENVDEVSGTIARVNIRRVGDVKKGYTFFRNSDVIFAKITPCMENGKCAVAQNLSNGIAFGSTEFHVVRAKQYIIPEWIYYFLRQEKIRQQATHWFRGTAGQQRVPSAFLEELKIPLPSLAEQQRIANLLARADRLRRLRRHARELSDSLLQSVFLEIFGEPRTNRKGWDITNIGDCVKPTKQINPLSLGHQEFWYVDITSIDKDTKTIVEPKLLKVDDAPSRARKGIFLNDILVSTVRPNLNAVAKVPASLDKQIASTGFCVLRANKDKILSAYLFAFVQSNYFVDFLIKNQTGANYPAVSDGIILDTPIPLPPLVLQEQFAGVVARYESLRARQAESARQGEGLFQSLLAQSFGGA